MVVEGFIILLGIADYWIEKQEVKRRSNRILKWMRCILEIDIKAFLLCVLWELWNIRTKYFGKFYSMCYL